MFYCAGTICYTSGTTGNPKGVTLTHQNVVAAICAVLVQLGVCVYRFKILLLKGKKSHKRFIQIGLSANVLIDIGLCIFYLCLSGDHRPRVGDVMISFLPLAHMLERCFENGIYYSGAAVGFYSGNIRDLTNDLKSLKPTIMPAVPRLLNRVYDKIQSEIARSSLKRFIYNMAIKSKEAELKRQILRKNSLWDRLVFRKIQDCTLQ